jgi:hypothetical protein
LTATTAIRGADAAYRYEFIAARKFLAVANGGERAIRRDPGSLAAVASMSRWHNERVGV